jgi:hypothetical protein
MFTQRWKTGLVRFVCGAAIFVAGALTTAAPRAKADDDCQKKLVHADHELDRAVDKHGYTSKQAEHWRHELREAREWCWEHRHRWWDEHEHRWHDQRDWDDHDHDHERH